jgi:hypothetical protein
MRRSKPPAITAAGPLAAAIALALSGCGDPVPQVADTAVVCVDRATMQRVLDGQCPDYDDDDDNDLFFLYYYPRGSYTQPVGGYVSGGSHLRPAGAKTIVKAPTTGGKAYSVPAGTGKTGVKDGTKTKPGKGGFGTTPGKKGG